MTSFRLRENISKKGERKKERKKKKSVRCPRETSVRVCFRNRLEQARGKWLLPLHTTQISLKSQVLLPGLNLSFITPAFQGSQSLGRADLKPHKWLRSGKAAVGCVFVLAVQLYKGSAQKTTGADGAGAQ